MAFLGAKKGGRGGPWVATSAPVLVVFLLLLLAGLDLAAGTAGSLRAEIRVERLPDGSLLLVGESRRSRSRAARGALQRRQPPRAIALLIDTHSRRQSLDPSLVQAVIQAESDYDRRALSTKGAIGLMQLMPATARELGVSDPWDPDQNIAGGTRYLRRMLDRFDGDVERALAGYNAGASAVERYGGIPPYAETTAYVDKVLLLYRGASPRRATGSARSAVTQAYRPIEIKRQSDGTLLLVTPD